MPVARRDGAAGIARTSAKWARLGRRVGCGLTRRQLPQPVIVASRQNQMADESEPLVNVSDRTEYRSRLLDAEVALG